MSDVVQESIAVIASEARDRALMRELIEASCLGLSHRVVPGVDDGPLEATYAVVVCHRATPAAPVPTLPDTDARSRVVVLSDDLSERTMVRTFESGAHHYFDIGEPSSLLQARLVAALRSHSRHFRRQLVVPPFRFDLAKRRAWRDERPVGLSPKEFDLAFYLFSNRGRTVGNRELMTAVWSLPRSMDSRRIDTAACRVRKKMALEETDGWHLRRLRGEGYLLITDTRESPREPGESGLLVEEDVLG